jgi:hypothetical protein
MAKEQSKREMLREQVVQLVKDFATREGGITMADVGELFGPPDGFEQRVSAALLKLPFKFD